jgi:hypothetical protein
MVEQFLAIADADKIHEYVFSPHELRLVRGGSALQSTLNMEVLPSLVIGHGAKRIYAGGGTTLASFAEEKDARSFCAAAEASYAGWTVTATATAAWVELGDGEFPEARDRLFGLLERRKNARNAHERPESSPFTELCSTCGAYPAAVRDPEPERAGRVCRACRQRLLYSDRSTLLPAGLEPAANLTEIGNRSQPAGYIALVYTDLDRAGAFLREHARTIESYGALSGRMGDSVKGAVHAGLEHAVPKGGSRVAGFEVLLLGGDDAVVALPANRLFAFLEKFQEIYHKAWKGGPHPSFSAGAVLTRAHTPIAAMLRQAEGLLRSAKRIPKTERAGLDSINDAVDYCIDAGIASDDLLGERAEVKRRGNERPRTMKPYTVAEAVALARGVSGLRQAEAPANKIRSLFDTAYQPLMQADLEYLFVLSRLERGHRLVLRKLVEGPEMRQTVWRPVRAGAEEATNLADIAELWEFCR